VRRLVAQSQATHCVVNALAAPPSPPPHPKRADVRADEPHRVQTHSCTCGGNSRLEECPARAFETLAPKTSRSTTDPRPRDDDTSGPRRRSRRRLNAPICAPRSAAAPESPVYASRTRLSGVSLASRTSLSLSRERERERESWIESHASLSLSEAREREREREGKIKKQRECLERGNARSRACRASFERRWRRKKMAAQGAARRARRGE
jgi:hypothetical protein